MLQPFQIQQFFFLSMRAYLAFLFITLFIAGCQSPNPQINVPSEYIIGESVILKVSGLEQLKEYKVFVRKTDTYNRVWNSETSFLSDKSGDINLEIQNQYYDLSNYVDGSRILWSMEMPAPPGKDWKAPKPKDYSEIDFYILDSNDTMTHATSKQWEIPPDVEYKELNHDQVARIFRPRNNEELLPGIILLGGSGGGLSWASRVGAILANEGYVTMALAYFNTNELPSHLAQIPLEYIYNAIDALKEEENVDPNKIGILGYSKGAELGMLIASKRPDIQCIATIAPGSAVFQGFKPPKYPVISSWSLDGEELTFVPNNYDSHFFKTYDGMYLWYRTLAQHEEVEAAIIPVEKINGNILMLSGVEDQIWPSTYMAEQIISRLHVSGFEHSYDHLAFPNAGHGIAEPPGHPITSISKRMGGTPEGNAYARAEGWAALKDFFSNSFDIDKED